MTNPTYRYTPGINDWKAERYRSMQLVEQTNGDFVNVSDGTPMPIREVPIPSTGNTSTTPLGSGATFSGEWEQNHASEVMVSMKTDNPGTLYFDFSNDGTNADSTFPVQGFRVAANIHEFHIAVKGPRYFRVRLVNDTGAQTYLRLYTYYGTFRAPNNPLNQSIGIDSDGASTRPTNFQDEVRLGRRAGVSGWTTFGYRTGLTQSLGESTIWAASGNHTILTSASTFTVTYNNATDGDGTSGATQMDFYYIDSDGLPAITPHTLGSSGSDVTSFSGLGINRVAVSANGGATYNVNAITVTATTGGTIQAIVPATQSVTQQCIFFTGSNHTALVEMVRANVITATKSATIRINGYVYNRQLNTRYEIYRGAIYPSAKLDLEVKDPIKFQLNATDVLYFTALSDSNNTAEINMRFSLNQYQLT